MESRECSCWSMLCCKVCESGGPRVAFCRLARRPGRRRPRESQRPFVLPNERREAASRPQVSSLEGCPTLPQPVSNSRTSTQAAAHAQKSILRSSQGASNGGDGGLEVLGATHWTPEWERHSGNVGMWADGGRQAITASAHLHRMCKCTLMQAAGWRSECRPFTGPATLQTSC